MKLVEQRLTAVANVIIENPETYPDDEVEGLIAKLEKSVGLETPSREDCPNCDSNQWFVYPTIFECASCGYEKEGR